MLKRATFPWGARLHRPSEYAAALKGKRVAKGALFIVSTPRQKDNGYTTARLGLIIAKRFAPTAASRNAIKRVIREAFRQQRHALPKRDYVFRLHRKIPSGSTKALKATVRTEVEQHLRRIMQ